jgi:hypothetical protein
MAHAMSAIVEKRIMVLLLFDPMQRANLPWTRRCRYCWRASVADFLCSSPQNSDEPDNRQAASRAHAT